VLVVAAGVVAACGDDPSPGEERASQVADAAADAGLADEVAELLADATRGVDGTYRVVYEVAAPGSDQPQRITVSQRPPERRLDIERPDGTADATIATGEGTYQCTTVAGDWRCDQLEVAPDPGGLFTGEAIDTLVGALTDGAASYEFTVEDRELLGVESRCLTTVLRAGVDDPTLGERGTLCLSPEGARLLTETPAGTLRAVAYNTELPEDAFALPAEPG